MDEGMLKEIKKAEEKARNVIEDAKKKSSAAAKNAMEEARRMEESEIESHSREMEKKFLKESESIKKEADAIVDKGRSNASRIMKRAESNYDEAISFLARKFKEFLE
jgi:vacuolar-type H+-ATPase subunit H